MQKSIKGKSYFPLKQQFKNYKEFLNYMKEREKENIGKS